MLHQGKISFRDEEDIKTLSSERVLRKSVTTPTLE